MKKLNAFVLTLAFLGSVSAFATEGAATPAPITDPTLQTGAQGKPEMVTGDAPNDEHAAATDPSTKDSPSDMKKLKPKKKKKH